LDRYAGRAESVDVSLDRSGRHTGPFGEPGRSGGSWCVQPEFFDDGVLALDEWGGLVELDVSRLACTAHEAKWHDLHLNLT
jgi:hypothetical protein